MAITNYVELQAAIADWLARSGDPTIADIAPDLIRLCETRINYGIGEPGEALYSPPLRVREMETRATAVASGEYVKLPADCLEIRSLKVNTAPERALSFVTPQQFAAATASASVGVPSVYTIAGGEIRLGPAPASAAPVGIELLYYAAVPALSAASPSNWLLEAVPNIYLYGALSEAAPYIGDDERAAQWFATFAGALKGLQAQNRRAKYGGTPLVMRAGIGTP